MEKRRVIKKGARLQSAKVRDNIKERNKFAYLGIDNHKTKIAHHIARIDEIPIAISSNIYPSQQKFQVDKIKFVSSKKVFRK